MAVRYLGPNADRMETALKQGSVGGWAVVGHPVQFPQISKGILFLRRLPLGRDVPSSCQIMSTTLLGTGRERERKSV